MIELRLETNDINRVLAAIGQLPYVQVADLIEKIRVQVVPQLQNQPQET